MIDAKPRVDSAQNPEGHATVSSWRATVPAADPPQRLTEALHADVCIVGAGIAGLTTAYLLAREGRSVVVLDDGPIGGGQTERTTAHLASAIDDRYVEIERIHGAEGAHLAAESHSSAIDRIEAIVREEQIDCEFDRVDGFLFVPPGESVDVLDRELEAAHRAGLGGVEKLGRVPGLQFDTGPCLRFPRQGQFHPLKYLNGLAAAIRGRGGRIETGVHVSEIKGGKPAHVSTKAGISLTADAVVVATNSPVNDRVAIHTKQAPYLSYVVALTVPRGAVPQALYWDTLDPYHYVRLQSNPSDPGHELLIVGGEDHKTGHADDAEQRYARLEAWTRERFPAVEALAFRWSGQVMETIDGLAFIGRNPGDSPNVYIATGDSGMGMTHGTIAGMVITSLILGKDHPWAKLYDPSRKPIRAAGDFIRENFDVASQYAGWLAPGDVASPEEVRPGCGGILRRGLNKIALYRDEQGTLHELSAICPHLGCVVAWNHSEYTWDCPCHGSRFDSLGEVINGPANSGLAPIAAKSPR